jgi:hypothetical protein
MKRLLFLLHRWVGLVLALFMSLWFITGLVSTRRGRAASGWMAESR